MLKPNMRPSRFFIQFVGLVYFPQGRSSWCDGGLVSDNTKALKAVEMMAVHHVEYSKD